MAALVDAGLKAEGASSSSLHFETLTSLTGFGLTAISSNGLWWAVATAGRVVIRAVSAPEQVAQMLQCVDKIDKIEFSPDGEYLMCALYARQAIQIFSMADPTWKCRINESAAGLISAVWAPDSRTVLTESDFGIQLSLWSLTDSSQAVISLPKPAQRQFKCQFTSFSDCNRFLAVVHRIDLQDMIGIYSLHPATEMVKFKARSGDVNVINWLPGGTHLITIDSPLTYKCCVYTPSGEVVFAYEAYQNALGIRTVTFTPAAGQFSSNGSWLAVGSFDSKIRLITLFSWQLAFTLTLCHIKEMEHSMVTPHLTTTVEISADDTLGTEWDNGAIGKTNTLPSQAGSGSMFVNKMLKALPKNAADPKTAVSSSKPVAGGVSTVGLPAFGVSLLAFSPQGDYLAATEESMPRCLWVYRTSNLKLCALVVFQHGITSAQWRPTGSDEPWLIVTTGSTNLYLWSPAHGPQIIDRPASTPVTSTRWTADGALVVAKGKDSASLCRITDAK